MLIASFSQRSLENACALWDEGQVVAIPTETVYGLAGDATNDKAITTIYSVKNRPVFNPLIIHCHSLSQAKRYAEFSLRAERVANAFWPGPLTLVLKRRMGCEISLLASAGLDTLALRIPAHPIALDLLRAYEIPLAAPSANLSNTISPTRAQDVYASLGERVPLILDGGDTSVGVESTILDLSGEEPVLLRPGGLALEVIEKQIGEKVLHYKGDEIKAPGMTKRHYAPEAKVKLNMTVKQNKQGEVLLGFGAVVGDLSLSLSGNLEEAAANLFRMLRDLDQPGIHTISIAPIPNHGLGLAINDRLRRAAAD